MASLHAPSTKTILQHVILKLHSSTNQRVDTHHSSSGKSLKRPWVYQALIIRWNLLLLPVRRLQIIVLFGRYHYWSLVDPPFFWQDVTWSLCVFQRPQSEVEWEALGGPQSPAGALSLNQRLPFKEASIIPEHYGWLNCWNLTKEQQQCSHVAANQNF